MKFEHIEISPAGAAQMLQDTDIKNRKISMDRVRLYARDMMTGNWHDNGEPIQIDTDGNVVNGQHRLNAIVMANVPVMMTVVSDIPKCDAMIYDKGRGRSTTDTMRISGISCDKGFASGIKAYLCGEDIGPKTVGRISDMEVVKYFAAASRDLQAVYKAVNSGARNPISRKNAVFAAAYAAFRCGFDNIAKITRFFTVVNTGFMESEFEKPAIYLRNYILRDFLKYSKEARGAPLLSVATQALYDYEHDIVRGKQYNAMVKPLYCARALANDPYLYGGVK